MKISPEVFSEVGPYENSLLVFPQPELVKVRVLLFAGLGIY
jgi:hypothetical protein